MAAQYQLAHDGFGGRAYSGVLSGGKFIACAAGSKDWDDYVKWLGEGTPDKPNKPDPWRSPADGGQALTPKDGDIVVGSMLWSIAHYNPELEGALPEEAVVWSSHMLNDPPAQAPAHAPSQTQSTPSQGSQSSSTTGSARR